MNFLRDLTESEGREIRSRRQISPPNDNRYSPQNGCSKFEAGLTAQMASELNPELLTNKFPSPILRNSMKSIPQSLTFPFKSVPANWNFGPEKFVSNFCRKNHKYWPKNRRRYWRTKTHLQKVCVPNIGGRGTSQFPGLNIPYPSVTHITNPPLLTFHPFASPLMGYLRF